MTTTTDTQVAEHHAVARGYAWGRQDAGQGVKDSGAAIKFAEAYSEHWRKYLTETEHAYFVPCLEDAFLNWQACGAIVQTTPSDGRCSTCHRSAHKRGWQGHYFTA